jgi:diacylglycerol kinase (ATP)
MKGAPFFIVNPHSGGGRAEALWKKLAVRVPQSLKPFESVFTQSAGDATLQTRLALKAGYSWIVAVGGDGTLHEVVNGFFEGGKPLSEEARLGIIPMGSGNDFRRSLEGPSNPFEILERLKEGKTRQVDTGKVSYKGSSGRIEDRYFLNMADFGLVGEVMKRVNASRKMLGSRFTYLSHGFRTLLTFRALSVEVETPERGYRFEKFVNGIVANGRFFGNGLQVAPKAKLDDGLFDVVIVEKLKASEFIRMLPKLYRGEEIQSRDILRFRTPKLSVRSLSGSPVPIETDGEVPGTLPADFEILPNALRICV